LFILEVVIFLMRYNVVELEFRELVLTNMCKIGT
jgi:hypothetical protein